MSYTCYCNGAAVELIRLDIQPEGDGTVTVELVVDQLPLYDPEGTNTILLVGTDTWNILLSSDSLQASVTPGSNVLLAGAAAVKTFQDKDPDPSTLGLTTQPKDSLPGIPFFLATDTDNSLSIKNSPYTFEAF